MRCLVLRCVCFSAFLAWFVFILYQLFFLSCLVLFSFNFLTFSLGHASREGAGAYGVRTYAFGAFFVLPMILKVFPAHLALWRNSIVFSHSSTKS